MPAEPDDDAIPAGRVIDWFDVEIVEFVLRWAPYGGPPKDECMPRFGMSPDHLQNRFREIIRTGQRRHLGEHAHALIERASRLADIGAADVDEEPRCDRVPPPVGRPVMRRGVWRWT